MGKLDKQFYEDRALRDAARDIFMADVAHAKVSLSGKGIASRVAGNIGDGAKDVFEVAKVQGEDNRGIIAVLIGALLLWFTRGPIMEILGLDEAKTEGAGEAEPEESSEETEADSEQLHNSPLTPEPPSPGDSDD